MPHAIKPAATIDELLYEAVQITRPLVRHITAAMEAGLAGTGVSAGMRAILEVVHRNGPMTVPEMTDRLQLKRQFVHRMVSDALACGFLEALPNPAHKRAHYFGITPAGRAAVIKIRDAEKAQLRAFLKNVPAADIEAHARIQRALNLFFAGVSGQKDP